MGEGRPIHPAAAGLGVPSLRTRDRLGMAIAVAVVALTVRFAAPEPPLAFAPRPDALHYVAGAQSIAQDGTYLLRLGPYRVRPMYPPGLPLLLAVALRAGLGPADLWRLSAVSGAAMAALLALLAAELALRYGRSSGTLAAQRWVGWTAGSASGLAWALSPVAVRVSRVVLSDQPAALTSLGALILMGGALALPAARRGGAKALGGGLLWGATCTLRPISGALLLVPIGLFAAAALWRGATRRVLFRLGMAAVGMAVMPLVVALLLLRSGLPPFAWSGYHFWFPDQFATLGETFQVKHAFESRELLGAERTPSSNLELAARVLLGWPGAKRSHRSGTLWPLIGWIAGVVMWRRAWQYQRESSWSPTIVGMCLLAWTLASVVVFSVYLYSGGRFYLAVLAIPALFFGVGCGMFVAAAGRRWPLALCALVPLLLFLLPARSARWVYKTSTTPRVERAVRQKVPRWLARPERARAVLPVPFDPVYAQALGLLPQAAVAEITDWGPLPMTWESSRLLSAGVLPPTAVRRARAK